MEKGDVILPQAQRSVMRNGWKELSLEAYRRGHFHTLQEARAMLGFADNRSLRKHIRVLEIPVYHNPLNGNFALISHEDLHAISSHTHRPLPKHADCKSSSITPAKGDVGVTRQLAELQVRYTREVVELERRIAFVEEQRAQDAQVYEQRIASLMAEHERVVNQLRERLQHFQDRLREATRVSRRVLPSSESKATIPRLPSELEPLEEFARTHHVDEREMGEAVERGYIPIVQGTWRHRRAVITRALDQAGQAAFYQIFYIKKGFSPCEHCFRDRHGFTGELPIEEKN